MPRDPYEELEVAEDASVAEIREAYLRLVRKYDPERGEFPNAQRMVDVNNAFEALLDAEDADDLQRRRDAVLLGTYTETDPESLADDEAGPPLSDEELDTLLADAAALAESGDWEQVAVRAEEILRSEPGSIDALLLRLESAYEVSDWQQALEAVWHVLELDPDNEDALLYGAGAAAEIDDWLEARGFAATALLLNPSSDEARSWWADCQARLHAQDEAEEMETQ